MAERGMLTCKEITALATDYAEGHLGAADRATFEGHLAGCAGCSAWVEQLATTALAVGALPEPAVPLEMRRELLERFDDWARHRGVEAPAAQPAVPVGRRRLGLAAALAAAATFGLLVALARRPSGRAEDWAVALVLAGVAVALAALGRRATLGLAAVAGAAALAAGLLAGGRGSLELATGLDCLLTVGAAAAGMAGVAWLVLRRGPGALVRSAAGSWAVAGALAGAAALQVTCGAHTSLAHHLTFHVGGVLAVAATALLVPRWRSYPA